MSKPLILVTNDDGITAKGIRCLIEVMRTIGEVVVVAPDKPQSGMGHAITIDSPLRLEEVKPDGVHKEYKCNGTAVDCVKIGLHKVTIRKPDLIVSGINHGSNSSINIIYSGTMSAALEGAMLGIKSIGFSLLDFSLDADFTATKPYIKSISENVLKHGLPEKTSLNVNFPSINGSDIKGVKICRQAHSYWKEQFDERIDPQKRNYYWLRGNFVNMDDGLDTDEWALANNYVSIVPVHFDFTAHKAINILNNWKFDVR